MSPLPDDVEALKSLVTAMARKADEAEAKLANAMAHQSAIEALIAHLKLQIAKLKREQYGPSAERSRRLLDQMELQLEELEADAAEDDLIAEEAAARTSTVTAFERKLPARKPFPDHLPRARVVVPAPCSCPACGGDRLSKLGEDVTETLEVIPRSWKVIQTVREKFACRDCEKIAQAPAPFHVVPRGWAGPSFLAMLLFEKYGQHQPLNRQAERFAREGVPLSLSTLADQVGAAAHALMPLYKLIEAHVLARHGRLVTAGRPCQSTVAQYRSHVRRCTCRFIGGATGHLRHSREPIAKICCKLRSIISRPLDEPCAATFSPVAQSLRTPLAFGLSPKAAAFKTIPRRRGLSDPHQPHPPLQNRRCEQLTDGSGLALGGAAFRCARRSRN